MKNRIKILASYLEFIPFPSEPIVTLPEGEPFQRVSELIGEHKLVFIHYEHFLIFVLSILLITGPLYGQGFPEPERVCAGCGAAIEKGCSLI